MWNWESKEDGEDKKINFERDILYPDIKRSEENCLCFQDTRTPLQSARSPVTYQLNCHNFENQIKNNL